MNLEVKLKIKGGWRLRVVLTRGVPAKSTPTKPAIKSAPRSRSAWPGAASLIQQFWVVFIAASVAQAGLSLDGLRFWATC